MKISKQICISITVVAVMLAVAMTWLPGSTQAEDTKMMKGAEHMMLLTAITTPEQAAALKPGDTIAMACAKCKTIIVEKVTVEKGHINMMTPGEKHLCSGCQTTLVTVGMGKNSHNELKHVCNACGSDLVFCCATSTNAVPTPSMATDK
jgi:hypothetical protein